MPNSRFVSLRSGSKTAAPASITGRQPHVRRGGSIGLGACVSRPKPDPTRPCLIDRSRRAVGRAAGVTADDRRPSGIVRTIDPRESPRLIVPKAGTHESRRAASRAILPASRIHNKMLPPMISTSGGPVCEC
jgi:hypothetical protein